MKELIAIQTELNCPKNQFNKFGGYKYRSLEDIFEGLKPLLKKYKCFVTVTDEIVVIGDRYYVKATATITNEKGEKVSNVAYAREPLHKKGMDEAQVTGATSSYARKYAMNGLFVIDDVKDADSMNNDDNSKLKEIEELLKKTKTDKVKFLQYFKVKKVEELDDKQIEVALQILNKKLKSIESEKTLNAEVENLNEGENNESTKN